MNLTYLLLLHTYPSPQASRPRPEDPKPEGGERETAADDEEDEPETVRNVPAPREPESPDTHPIDPRVLNGDRDHG